MPPPSNRLAPEPVNKLDSLLAEAAKHPQYGEVVDYLTQRGMMPPINLRYLGNGVAARFNRDVLWDTGLPKTGVVELDKANPRASSLLHELTHAADVQIYDQYSELKRKRLSDLTPQQKRFMDSFEKGVMNRNLYAFNPAKFPREQTANKLSPAWATEHKEYRASHGELPAWGMGSTIEPSSYKGYPAPQHLDPTMATEFLILMDSARRAMKK